MNHIQEVAARLRGLRDALELTAEEMAHQCDVSPEVLAAYERRRVGRACQFSPSPCLGLRGGTTALLFGEEPTMNSYFVTRAGKGVKGWRGARRHTAIRILPPDSSGESWRRFL